MMKNILCVIPARGRSKRIANKNLKLISGKPLMAYTIEKALESKLCSKVVVSSDDHAVTKLAKRYGLEVIPRPAELSRDNSAIDDALRHAVRFMKEKDGFKADIVVMLQANVPVRKSGEIDAVIKKLLILRSASAVATVYFADQRPEWMKKIDLKSGRIVPFMKPTNLYRKQDLPQLYLLDGAVTVIRTNSLMKTDGLTRIHAFLGEKVYPFLHERKFSIEVDEPDDIGLAEYFLSKERLNK